MDEGQALALFIRISLLHSHRRTSETGTGRLATKGCVVLGLIQRFNIMYELHFRGTRRRTAGGLATSLNVDLLDETLKGKINKTAPLIRYKHIEYKE